MAVRRRWPALPMGELHSEELCALCGDKHSKKRRTVLVSTHAVAQVCDDMVGCLRRRHRQRNP